MIQTHLLLAIILCKENAGGKVTIIKTLSTAVPGGVYPYGVYPHGWLVL